jgi:hypothetical protein
MSPARLTLLVVSLAALIVAAPAQAAYRLTPADKRALGSAIDRFVWAAVQRHDLAGSYDLVTPNFRAGISRRAWAKGTTTVMSYPARGKHFGWTVDFAVRGDVVADVMLQPRRRAKVGAMIFSIELKKRHGRWLVDSLLPAASFADSGRTGNMHAFNDYGPNAVRNPDRRKVDPLLLVLPGSILLLIVAFPTAIILRGWRRNRRAERAYAGELPRTLPPLPPLPPRS